MGPYPVPMIYFLRVVELFLPPLSVKGAARLERSVWLGYSACGRKGRFSLLVPSMVFMWSSIAARIAQSSEISAPSTVKPVIVLHAVRADAKAWKNLVLLSLFLSQWHFALCFHLSSESIARSYAR